MVHNEEQLQKLQRQDYGARFNEGKLQWSLMDMDAFRPMIQVLMFGAKKYAAHNWKKGFTYTDLINSSMRHMQAFLAGEDLDRESGLPHVGHIQCNDMFLGYMYQFRKDMDDRYIDANKAFDLNISIGDKAVHLELCEAKKKEVPEGYAVHMKSEGIASPQGPLLLSRRDEVGNTE